MVLHVSRDESLNGTEFFFARTHAHFSSRFVTTCNRQTFNSPIAYMPMSTRINDNTMLTSWKTFK